MTHTARGLGGSTFRWFAALIFAGCTVAAVAQPSITLNADDTCYQVGDTVTVEIDLAGAPALLVGGQFFLDYDATSLTFVSATPGDAPFTREIFESVGGGLITYAVGVPDAAPGAMIGTMAVLTFTAAAEICDAADLVDYRVNISPTRITDEDDVNYDGANLTLIGIDNISIDSTPPTLQNLPAAAVTVQCDAIPTAPTVTAVDTCDPSVSVIYVETPNLNGCGGYTGTIARVWSATDDCGNLVSFTQTITVIDTAAPSLSGVPANTTIECSDPVPAPPTVTAGDTCDTSVAVTMNQVNNLVGCNGTGTITRTWSATDDCGNTVNAMQVITVVDTTAPMITCPANASYQCIALVPPAMPFTGSASDNCGGVTVTLDSDTNNGGTGCPASPLVITRVYRATDACGLSATCTQTITVIDTTAPTITCPADASFQCASQVPAPDVGLVSTADNCGGVTVTHVGDANNGGTGCSASPLVITRTYRATDACGNTADCMQTFTVIDTTPPTAVCQNITVPLDAAGLATITAAQVDNGSSDNCSAVSLSVSPSSFTCANIGSNTVTLTVTDACGLTATCNATVTVVDNLAPAAACASLGIALDPTGNYTLTTADIFSLSVESSDNCGIVSRVASPDTFTCANVGFNNVTITLTDASGNVSQCIATVGILDETVPTITCPPDVTVSADAGGCTANAANVALGTPITADACGISEVFNDAPAVFPVGNTLVHWYAIDVNSNIAFCTQNVTVLAQNLMSVSVELAGIISTGTSPDTLTRCITFELYSCPSATPTIVTADVNFAVQTAQPTIGTGVIAVPCGAYSCVTARDALHTLRRTDAEFAISGTQYVANFTAADGGDALVGGNMNDDEVIDILDFGIFVNRFGLQYDSDADTIRDGHTPCAWTPAPMGPRHADVSGDGLVDSADFTFVQINFLQFRELNCCGLPNSPNPGVTTITVQQLIDQGMADLTAADLTRDGVLDSADIAAFVGGRRPGDMNCDGLISVGDIGGFVKALTDPLAYAAVYPTCFVMNADVNGDGLVTVSDIGPFVNRLAP